MPLDDANANVPRRGPAREGQGRLDRLGAAMEALLRFRDHSDGDDRERFLARHEDLRDLLEPMLVDGDAEPAEEAGPAPSPDGLQPGRQIGDYRIVREIGRGGMGIVFEAEQLSLRRRVALKVLHPQLAWSANSIERFRHEAAAAGGLRHAAIVPIHEVGEWRGLHFFSMEFVDGQPLSELLHKDRLGVRGDCSRAAEAAELIAQVADALQHAHEHDLVHRDVKPHNIMLGHDGSVRLLDFGLVKSIAATSQSVTGAFLGTPHYCSPEQGTRQGAVGPRSDVFSLAIVLYEVLARRRPFDGETTRAVLQRIEAGEFEPLRRIAPATPRDLETICHKALETAPADRYASAGAFAEDLRRFLRGEPILAEPPGGLARGLKWMHRHRVRVASWAAGVMLVLGGPAAYALHQHNKAVAIERERQALDAAEGLGFRSIEQTLGLLGEQLERQPGLPAQHRARVDDVVRLCEGFLTLRASDPKRRARVARALYVTSYVYGRLEQFDAALAACERALELVGAAGPGGDTMPGLEARLVRRRIHLQQLVRPSEANAEFEQATAHWRALAEAPDADVEAAIEYAETLLVRARTFADLPRRRTDAEALARRALAILTGARCAGDARAQLTALRASTVLGHVLLYAGRANEALAVLEPSARRLEQLPKAPLEGVELALTTAAIGEAQQRLGRTGSAEKSLRAAIAEATELLAAYPGARSLRRTLMRSQIRLSATLMARQDFVEAEQVLRTAGSLHDADAADTWLDRSLRGSLDAQLASCILMRSKGEERTEARALFGEACELFESVVAERPEMLQFSTELGGALNNLAGIANQGGQHREAVEFATRAIAQQRRVLAATPADEHAEKFLGMHHGQLALAHAHLGEFEDAIRAAVAATEHAPRNTGTLRLAAESACLCAQGIAADSQPDAERRRADAERYSQVAVDALRKIAAVDAKEAHGWLLAPRFAALSGRDDFQKLLEETAR
ncbi:MAG TPA: serine/threonine-protein kinase [Planctomycetota bacterium]|nr:serine/threonine-protein kinase [Planctomycetota bacterium]